MRSCRRVLIQASASALLAVSLSHAQVELHCTTCLAGWGVDSAYIGAQFVVTSPAESVTVFLKGASSSATGALYFMVPGYDDSAMYLFKNHPTGEPTEVNLGTFPRNTPIVFMYAIVDQARTDPQGNPLPRKGTRTYTGQNREGIDQYVSERMGFYGRRFAVMGRSLGRTDRNGVVTHDSNTVYFGFEDASDYDFNDIVFGVTGIKLEDIEIYKLPPPSADPHPAIESFPNQVALSVEVEGLAGVQIFYGLDGAPPATRYAGPISLDKSKSSVTVRAWAHVDDSLYLDSDTISYIYTNREFLPAPVVNPYNAGGVHFLFDTSVTVTVPGHADAAIYYTTDGSTPGPGSALYTGPVTIDRSTALKAIAVKAGYENSPVTTAVFVRDPNPTLWLRAVPGSTSFNGSVSVTLEATAGASVYYTLDGSAPARSSIPYTGSPITLDATTTLRALAVKAPADSATISQTYTRLAVVTQAWYADANADGAIDRAVLLFDALPSGTPASVLLTDPLAGTTQSLASLQAAGTTVTVTIIPPFASGTGFVPGSYGRIPSGAGDFDTAAFAVADSVAPVLTSAGYRPGTAADLPGGRHPDTLTVRFSEPTVIAGSAADTLRPFTLIGPSGAYTLALRALSGTAAATTHTFEVLAIEGVSYPHHGDSVRIVVNGAADAGGAVQRSAANRAVALAVTYPPVALTHEAGPNPFVPGVTPIPREITQRVASDPLYRGTTHGTVVMVKPTVSVDQSVFSINGSVTLYDVVGNVVLSSRPMVHDADGRLYLLWDGKNENGRTVGTGTYLAVIETEDTVNGATVERRMIGVSR